MIGLTFFASLFGVLVSAQQFTLDDYRVWERDNPGQVDIYTGSTLAITRLNDKDEIVGYFHHLDTRTNSPLTHYPFAQNVCTPYTILQWYDGEPAVLGGGCAHNGRRWHENASLLLGGQRLFLPFSNFTDVKYDWHTKRIYIYRHPYLYSLDAQRSFELINTYNFSALENFYVSGGVIFHTTTNITTDNNTHAFVESTGVCLPLGASPHGAFYRFYIRQGEMFKSSGAMRNGFISITTLCLSLLLLTVVIYQ